MAMHESIHINQLDSLKQLACLAITKLDEQHVALESIAQVRCSPFTRLVEISRHLFDRDSCSVTRAFHGDFAFLVHLAFEAEWNQCWLWTHVSAAEAKDLQSVVGSATTKGPKAVRIGQSLFCSRRSSSNK